MTKNITHTPVNPIIHIHTYSVSHFYLYIFLYNYVCISICTCAYTCNSVCICIYIGSSSCTRICTRMSWEILGTWWRLERKLKKPTVNVYNKTGSWAVSSNLKFKQWKQINGHKTCMTTTFSLKIYGSNGMTEGLEHRNPQNSQQVLTGKLKELGLVRPHNSWNWLTIISFQGRVPY